MPRAMSFTWHGPTCRPSSCASGMGRAPARWWQTAGRSARSGWWTTHRNYYILDADGSPADLPHAPPAATQTRIAVPDDLRAMGGRRLVGVGVAAGRTSGRARIVRHPENGHRLERGEILIAPSTD